MLNSENFLSYSISSPKLGKLIKSFLPLSTISPTYIYLLFIMGKFPCKTRNGEVNVWQLHLLRNILIVQ